MILSRCWNGVMKSYTHTPTNIGRYNLVWFTRYFCQLSWNSFSFSWFILYMRARMRDLKIWCRPLGVRPALLETGNVSTDIWIQRDRIERYVLRWCDEGLFFCKVWNRNLFISKSLIVATISERQNIVIYNRYSWTVKCRKYTAKLVIFTAKLLRNLKFLPRHYRKIWGFRREIPRKC